MTLLISVNFGPDKPRMIVENFLDSCTEEQLKENYEWSIKAKEDNNLESSMREFADMVYRVIEERKET